MKEDEDTHMVVVESIRLMAQIHCRPDITRMSVSTTSDRVISESRYTEVY